MATKRDTFWYLMLADVLHTILLVLFFFMFKKVRGNKDNMVLGFSEKKVNND